MLNVEGCVAIISIYGTDELISLLNDARGAHMPDEVTLSCPHCGVEITLKVINRLDGESETVPPMPYKCTECKNVVESWISPDHFRFGGGVKDELG